MYRTILVPLDGSPFAEHALPLALNLARRAGAALRLVHVYSPTALVYPELYPVDGDSFECEIKTGQRIYLEGVVRRIAEVALVPTTFDILEGDVAPTIQQEAARINADLVVMTTHGRGQVARFWLGSVADRLIRDLPAPLLLMQPTDDEIDWKRDPLLRHILVPLDGSALAEQIVEPAVALGSLAEADYTLVRVIAPPPPAHREDSDPTRAERRRLQHEKLQKEAQQYLDHVGSRLQERSLQVATTVASGSSPAAAILHRAVQPKVDLIALATHGRSAVARMVLGSVADKVIRGSTLPVLVHRPSI